MAQPFVDQPPPSLPPRKLLARSLNRHLPACTGWLWGSLLLGRASSNLHERLAGPCLLTLACVLAASGSRRVCTEGGRASAACIHSLRSRGWGCACCAAIKSRNKPCMAGSSTLLFKKDGRPGGLQSLIDPKFKRLMRLVLADFESAGMTRSCSTGGTEMGPDHILSLARNPNSEQLHPADATPTPQPV